ncbi:ankyrin repeat domain-containing protein [Pseudoflavitalea sp. X16]|uniref:ankyrin repeat domain-containing protein n=1 Tax=Paraflavitalea devenefica TaxID=2716334 RepID=UPI00141DD639|nr:ankyrin repeat domain-containing protein [Paraflavitalea devenefica]NII28520.1 ankyrin repeat domain-containing protein [Paraflavitalea devenefica]
MYPPEALTKDEPLFWSTGKGTDVWAMFCAARKGDLPAIQSLLSKDPSLLRSEYDYRNPMSFAVRENQPAVVAYLLEHGASPINSGTGDTLLQIARDRGYTEIQHLVENAITGQQGTPEGNAIAAAIRNRDMAQVRALLDASPELVHARDDTTNQAIHWATMSRQPDMMDEVLARGADINSKRSDGARPIHLCNGDYGYRGWRDVPKDTVATPRDIFNHLMARGAQLDLYMAALTGNITRVRELLDQDPALVNRISDCRTGYPGSGAALTNAATGGHIAIVRLLLERGADPSLPEPGNAPQGKALYEAVAYKHMDIVQLLLDHGAYPNPEVESSGDALSRAMHNDDKPMIELLCIHGATRKVHLLAYDGDLLTGAAVFAANPALANNVNALENAASEGHGSFVRLMLRYQPQLAKQIAISVKSRGPQDVAASRELTNFLFQQGMDANYRSWLGITPLHVYARRNDIENVTLFLEHRADINAVEEEFYSTPLGLAAKYGKLPMVEFLLKQGADPNKAGAPWATPLAWATRRGHQDVITLLKQYNAHE